MFEQIHQFELTLITALQEIRSPALDLFFRILDLIDREYFPLLILPIIWLGISWRWGARFFYILAISIFINNFLKDYFAQPRPFEIIPTLAVVLREGYGFPSGASQNAVIFLGMLAYMIKNRAFTYFAIFFILLMGFSRVYLGVHFLTDVLAGWAIGGIILLLYCLSLEKVEQFLAKQSTKRQILLSIFVPLSLLLINHSLISLSIVCIIIGVSLGLIINWNSIRISKGYKTRSQKILSSVLGVVGLMVIFGVTKGLLEITSSISLQAILIITGYFLLGIWLSYGVNYCFKKS